MNFIQEVSLLLGRISFYFCVSKNKNLCSFESSEIAESPVFSACVALVCSSSVYTHIHCCYRTERYIVWSVEGES